jgi:hypothetical protein
MAAARALQSVSHMTQEPWRVSESEIPTFIDRRRQRVAFGELDLGPTLREPPRFAFGTLGGASDEPTLYVRGRRPSTYRSSVVILGVAATITWLAVVLICLLA